MSSPLIIPPRFRPLWVPPVRPVHPMRMPVPEGPGRRRVGERRRGPLAWAMAHLQKRDGHLLKSGAGPYHLAKSCCPCAIDPDLCGCGPVCEYCGTCAFEKASAAVHLANFNGCYDVGGGRWLKVAFADVWPTFCLSHDAVFNPGSWKIQYTSSGGLCCFGSFAFYSNSGCTSFFSNPTSFAFSVTLTKTSLTEWRLLVRLVVSDVSNSIFATIDLIDDTWTVDSGDCDPTRVASTYSVVPCVCPERTAVTPPSGDPPNRATVILQGLVGKLCELHPSYGPYYGSLIDEGNGTWDFALPVFSFVGTGTCGATSAPAYLKWWTDSSCSAELDFGTRCPGTSLDVGASSAVCANCSPTISRHRVQVRVLASPANAWVFLGTGYGTSAYDVLTMRNELSYPTTVDAVLGSLPVWVESGSGFATLVPYRV